MTTRYFILDKIKEKFSYSEISIVNKLLSEVISYYEKDNITNETIYSLVFQYMYLEDKYYSYEEIAYSLGFQSPTSIYRIAMKIDNDVRNIIIKDDRFIELRKYLWG